jgi:hypothetical protein
MCAASLSPLPRTTSGQQVVPTWPGPASGSETWKQREETTALPQVAGGAALVRNVTRPTLTVFVPDRSKATGAAVNWLSWWGISVHVVGE